MTKLRSSGGLALVVVVLSALILAVIFWSVNRDQLPGPAITTGSGGGSSLVAEDNGTPLAGIVTSINAGVDIDATITAGVLTINNVRPTATPADRDVTRSFQRREADTVIPSYYAAGCISLCARSAATNAGNTDDRILALPFYNDNESATVDSISIGIETVGAAGERARLGIYIDDGDNHPGDLLVDAGTVLIDSGGIKTAAFTATALVEDQLYWVTIVSDSATATFSALSGFSIWAVPLGTINNQTNRVNWGWKATHLCGAACVNALPDPFPTTAQDLMNNVNDGASHLIFLEID